MTTSRDFRQPALVKHLTEAIAQRVTRPWTLMEVCGGQTHSLLRYGIDRLLPPGVELLHGPGCPVCVTPSEGIDRAIALALTPKTIMTSFGDMLRVRGSTTDLLSARAQGGDVRALLSPLDALRIAEEHPEKDVVFFAVGFETTTPSTAIAVSEAKRRKIHNFSLLVRHVRVAPAMEALLLDPLARMDGFLAAGHVATVMGTQAIDQLANRHQIPIVVTGFEPIDLLGGIYQCLSQLEAGRYGVSNAYPRAVKEEGNIPAQTLIKEVFDVIDLPWRGLGLIPAGGYCLSPRYRDYDAEIRFSLGPAKEDAESACRSGDVLRGIIKPDLCPAFGTLCTPEHPLGATMVSGEGACAAYFHYRGSSPAPTRATS